MYSRLGAYHIPDRSRYIEGKCASLVPLHILFVTRIHFGKLFQRVFIPEALDTPQPSPQTGRWEDGLEQTGGFN
jgi:hypothetical protein